MKIIVQESPKVIKYRFHDFRKCYDDTNKKKKYTVVHIVLIIFVKDIQASETGLNKSAPKRQVLTGGVYEGI